MGRKKELSDSPVSIFSLFHFPLILSFSLSRFPLILSRSLSHIPLILFLSLCLSGIDILIDGTAQPGGNNNLDLSRTFIKTQTDKYQWWSSPRFLVRCNLSPAIPPPGPPHYKNPLAYREIEIHHAEGCRLKTATDCCDEDDYNPRVYIKSLTACPRLEISCTTRPRLWCADSSGEKTWKYEAKLSREIFLYSPIEAVVSQVL